MSAPSLRPQQERAVQWLRSHDRGMLAGQMRTGKTATVLSALEPRHLPALVVSTRAISQRVWVEEAALWRPDLQVVAAVGAPAKRAAALRGTADVVSLSIASLDGHERAGGLRRFRTLIIDESTLVKSPSSARSLAARRVSDACGHCWALTGTPVPATTVDLWSQWRVIDGGRTLGRSVTRFRDRWQTAGHSLPSGAVVGREDRPGSLERVCAMVAPLTHVMLAQDAGRGVPCALDLDPHPVRMGREWSELYRRLKRKRVLHLDDGGSVVGGSAGVTQLRLRQILAGEAPLEEGGSVVTDETRLLTAVDLIVDSATTVSPVAAVYQLIAERDRARELLEARGLQAAEVRERGAVEAWREGRLDVLLLHPASAGHGLTLHSGGCEMVWLSLPWSSEHWQQACARLTVWSEDASRPPRSTRVRIVPALLSDGSPTVDQDIVERLRSRGSNQSDALHSHLQAGG